MVELVDLRPVKVAEPEWPDLGEPRSALEYVQDVYKGRRQYDPDRFRAAREALAYESPKLAVVAQLSEQSIGDLLERRLFHTRRHYPEAPCLIELKPEKPE
jgi:hypothetical protein